MKKFEKGSGNIFKDLDLPNPGLENMKAQLAFAIFQIIEKKSKDSFRAEKKKLTQSQIGKLLGIDQTETSKLINGKYSRFSLERLLYFFCMLNYNINIKLSPAQGKQTQNVLVTEKFPHKYPNNEYRGGGPTEQRV